MKICLIHIDQNGIEIQDLPMVEWCKTGSKTRNNPFYLLAFGFFFCRVKRSFACCQLYWKSKLQNLYDIHEHCRSSQALYIEFFLLWFNVHVLLSENATIRDVRCR
jgi:hypothetical protein